MWSPDRERSKENQWWRHNFIFTSIWRICKPCIDAFDIIYAVECKLVYYKELNVFVAKKIVMISKTMSYTKTLSRKWNLLPTERWRRKNGNYFLLRIHLSMFFLFPLAESHFENPERIVRNTFKDLETETNFKKRKNESLRGSQLKQHQWGWEQRLLPHIVFRILINSGPASTNGGWILIFTKLRDR